jgi:hypothetical protein
MAVIDPFYAGRDTVKKEPDTPQGTLVLMGVFVLMIIAFWANAFFTVLSRGATQ